MTKQNVKMTNIILPASKRDVKEINIDNHKIKVDPHGHGNFTSDNGLAEEIKARHSAGKKGELTKDFVVSPVPIVTELHHNYFFGSMPEMPWKRKKETEDG